MSSRVRLFKARISRDRSADGHAAALARVPRLKPGEVDEVFFGNVLSAGYDLLKRTSGILINWNIRLGQNVARQCALGGGLPVTTICTTINKVCASSMKAIILAAQTIQLGHADVVVAGGTESMSNVPDYVPSDRKQAPAKEGRTNGLTTDGLKDAYGSKEHMGVKGELCASQHGIDREAQDGYALDSYRKAQSATAHGWFRDEMAPVKVTIPGKRPVLVKEDEALAKVSQDLRPGPS